MKPSLWPVDNMINMTQVAKPIPRNRKLLFSMTLMIAFLWDIYWMAINRKHKLAASFDWRSQLRTAAPSPSIPNMARSNTPAWLRLSARKMVKHSTTYTHWQPLPQEILERSAPWPKLLAKVNFHFFFTRVKRKTFILTRSSLNFYWLRFSATTFLLDF